MGILPNYLMTDHLGTIFQAEETEALRPNAHCTYMPIYSESTERPFAGNQSSDKKQGA
jgi:hypothetical protein